MYIVKGVSAQTDECDHDYYYVNLGGMYGADTFAVIVIKSMDRLVFRGRSRSEYRLVSAQQRV